MAEQDDHNDQAEGRERREGGLAVIPARPEYRDPVLGATLIVAALLLFWSLDGRYLWQDEAETALLAKSILKHGVPIGFDGKNFVSQEASKEFVARSRLPYFLWRWSPWVQFYIAAGSFALFGVNTLAARLPFALLGLLTVYLTYLLALRLSVSLTVARLSAFYLTVSVPFLLHVRQARWCAPAYCIFLCLLLSLEGIRVGRKNSCVRFVASGVLLFYTNYFVAIGLLMSVLAAVPFLSTRQFVLRKLFSSYISVALLVLPGFFLFQVLNKRKSILPSLYLRQFYRYECDYFTYIMPLPLLAVLLCLLVMRRPFVETSGAGRRPILFLLAISVLYLGYVASGPWLEFRYITVLLPIAPILLAVVTTMALRVNVALGVLIIAVLFTTDILHRLPLGYLDRAATSPADRFPSIGPVRFPFLGFLYELTHHFDAPEYVLAQYLNLHARESDVVVTTYDDLPLQFYTRLRVAGGLEGRKLPESADWLIKRRWIHSSEPGKDGDVDTYIAKLLEKSTYTSVPLHKFDHMLGTNPDPKNHLFATPAGGPQLILLRKQR
jgi:hypothetical protein